MRIRTVKPEFWMHEGLAGCCEFTRLLAIALLNWSDDEGYFMANPILIRGQVFPFLDDSKKIPRSLLDLSRVGWIQLGKDDQGRDVGKVINFAKHQRVDKPKTSQIKALAIFQDPSKIDPRSFVDASKEEGKGMDQGNGIGMERERNVATDGTSSDPPLTAKSISWSVENSFAGITDQDMTEWLVAYPALDLKSQIAQADQWLKNNPLKRKKHIRRFLCGWFSRSQERGGDVKSNRINTTPQFKGLQEDIDLPE